MSPSIQRIAGAVLGVLLGAAAVDSAGVVAAAATERANELKAAYLFNFATLVEWPVSAPTAYLTICFAGASGVHEAFARAAGHKLIGERRVVVRDVDVSQRVGCDVLYLEASVASGARLVENPTPTLTVSDAQDFLADGGMIELFSEGNRLRFNINLPSAQRAGLRISSSLLQLAARIEKGSDR